VTPGGLGVVEVTMVAITVGFGAPRPTAVLAVLGYRIVNYWLQLIPVPSPISGSGCAKGPAATSRGTRPSYSAGQYHESHHRLSQITAGVELRRAVSAASSAHAFSGTVL
jgi:Lysylphosphatidylglycerol synthase TM region